MDPRGRRTLGLRVRGALLGLALHLIPVCCIEVSAPEEIKAVRGETVTLSCSFTSTSRTTELLSVNWSFRPQSGGLAHNTILTVTPKKVGVRFSDVAVLLVLVIVPSGLIALALLVQILCPCCSPVKKSAGLGHHSPIEVTDGEDRVSKQPKQKTPTCCELYLLDSDDEEYHHHHEKQHMEAIAESQC
ncbi:hypothetical protein AOLI_G00325740 [Acnodon oligacanthus]